MRDLLPPITKQPKTGKVRSESSGKQLANRVSNTSQEMAEYAWRYALADINRKAHGKK